MTTAKKGDTVICINNSGEYLTLNKEYPVLDSKDDGFGGWEYLIKDDSEVAWYLDSTRFIKKNLPYLAKEGDTVIYTGASNSYLTHNKEYVVLNLMDSVFSLTGKYYSIKGDNGNIWNYLAEIFVKKEEKTMCNDFNFEKFNEFISRSNLSKSMKHILKNAVKYATGEPVLEVKIGGVYRSPNGMRLLIKASLNYIYIIRLRDFSQLDASLNVGHRVDSAFTDMKDVENYMLEHNYEYLGQLSMAPTLGNADKKEYYFKVKK